MINHGGLFYVHINWKLYVVSLAEIGVDCEILFLWYIAMANVDSNNEYNNCDGY
jgi:hypothetical protein